MDEKDENKLFVGIELGGIMRSLDKGETWEDRKPNSQFDCHTMTTHPLDKNKIFEAAGGGFAFSEDGGDTWTTENEGLDDNNYLVNIAVDQHHLDCILVAGAKSPRQSYNADNARTFLYKKEDNKKWRRIEEGFPKADGLTVSALAASKTKHGLFYAANNKGVFYSKDCGESWNTLSIDWKDEYLDERIKQLILLD